ncbi:MAG: hypothetical protein ACJA1C_002002 [Crocinitomicaceae bacterium]
MELACLYKLVKNDQIVNFENQIFWNQFRGMVILLCQLNNGDTLGIRQSSSINDNGSQLRSRKDFLLELRFKYRNRFAVALLF